MSKDIDLDKKIDEIWWTMRNIGENRKLIKELIKSTLIKCLGEMEYRETYDMSLSEWDAEDFKAFGRNELRNTATTNLIDMLGDDK